MQCIAFFDLEGTLIDSINNLMVLGNNIENIRQNILPRHNIVYGGIWSHAVESIYDIKDLFDTGILQLLSNMLDVHFKFIPQFPIVDTHKIDDFISYVDLFFSKVDLYDFLLVDDIIMSNDEMVTPKGMKIFLYRPF